MTSLYGIPSGNLKKNFIAQSKSWAKKTFFEIKFTIQQDQFNSWRTFSVMNRLTVTIIKIGFGRDKKWND